MNTKKIKKASKEDILDEDFIKAKIITEKRLNENNEEKKKPFFQSGILLIIVAIICIALITYTPWAYIKADQENSSESADMFILKDFDKNELEYTNESVTIISVFEPKNCSNGDCNYLGLTYDDFSDTPKATIYGFIGLAVLGFIFVIFQILDRKKNFDSDMFALVHSIFAVLAIIISVFILTLILKFFGVYLLLFYNSPLYLTENIAFVSPIAIALGFVLLGIVKASFSILKINCNNFIQKHKEKENKNPFFIYRGGVKPE